MVLLARGNESVLLDLGLVERDSILTAAVYTLLIKSSMAYTPKEEAAVFRVACNALDAYFHHGGLLYPFAAAVLHPAV